MMHSMHLSRWMKRNLILGSLSMFTDNQDYNTFSESLISWLIFAPLQALETPPDGLISKEAHGPLKPPDTNSGRRISEMAVA